MYDPFGLTWWLAQAIELPTPSRLVSERVLNSSLVSQNAGTKHGMYRSEHHRCVRVTITGINLPGRLFCRPDGSTMDNVHVGLQLQRNPAQLVRADESETRWEVDVDVVGKNGVLDFRGPAVQGKRGDRFVYLTWGDVGSDGAFEMFRRAKLSLDRIEPALIESAMETGRLAATVDLTGDDGGPRCARVDPPAVEWSVPEA